MTHSEIKLFNSFKLIGVIEQKQTIGSWEMFEFGKLIMMMIRQNYFEQVRFIILRAHFEKAFASSALM